MHSIGKIGQQKNKCSLGYWGQSVSSFRNIFKGKCHKQTRTMSELIETNLKFTAVNGIVIPYIGWVKLAFTLSSKSPQAPVPFLVTTETIVFNNRLQCD